jgi:hypothetical protein
MNNNSEDEDWAKTLRMIFNCSTVAGA